MAQDMGSLAQQLYLASSLFKCGAITSGELRLVKRETGKRNGQRRCGRRLSRPSAWRKGTPFASCNRGVGKDSLNRVGGRQAGRAGKRVAMRLCRTLQARLMANCRSGRRGAGCLPWLSPGSLVP